LSRNPDNKNYQLDRTWFLKICQRLKIFPTVDLFASARNKQIPKYCSWRIDPKSLGNAWQLNWGGQVNWLNPPWECVQRALQKLQQDRATALVCLPVWKSAPWWRLVRQMQKGPEIIVKGETLFQDPEKNWFPPPTMGNPFHSAPKLTLTQLRERCRLLENAQDIPVRVRLEWLERAQTAYPKERWVAVLRQAAKRVARGKNRAKYPDFPDISPLVTAAFAQPSSLLLLDRLILQLRLTTLMRSVDLANVVWGVFAHEGRLYLRTTAKPGSPQSFSITNQTKSTVIEYLFEHRNFPGPFLLRHTTEKHQCLSAERIAKRLLLVMQRLGYDTDVWKAHSVRGATATHLLESGTPQSWVQARGGWTSSGTLDNYYARLHQRKDWQGLLQGETAEIGICVNCVLPPPKFSRTSSTKEDEGVENEGEGNTQVTQMPGADCSALSRCSLFTAG
jgi:hypothetical protein